MEQDKGAALVTGAGRGLGEALAVELAATGRPVVLVARDETALGDVARRIRGAGGRAFVVPADVGAPDAAARIAGSAVALAGPIDLLIHNASTLGPVPLRTLLDTAPDDFSRVLEVNLTGPFRLSRLLVGPMVLRGRGTVVYVSSDAAVEAYPTWGAYAVSKAALDHLARIEAAELAGTGVRVLTIDPGEMRTRMHADAVPDADPVRLADPREVAAHVVAILASGAPSGQRLRAAGATA